MFSLLVSEAKSEAHQNHELLYFATLDSQKAFDVVHHTVLLDKLSDKGILRTFGFSSKTYLLTFLLKKNS